MFIKRMDRRQWLQNALVLTVVCMLASCSGMRKLAEQDPQTNLALPGRQPVSTPNLKEDTITKQPPKTISFRKEDGTEIFLTPTTIDSASGQAMISLDIEEVVISARTMRNIAERNGKINIDFVVTIPAEFYNKSWRLVLSPKLGKGDDTLSLNPLVYSGDRFKESQRHDYNRYEAYLDRIVDNADYFELFGKQSGYNRHLRYLARERANYTIANQRIAAMTPKEAICDKQVGWSSRSEERRKASLMRGYIYHSDRVAARNTTYVADPSNNLDHLNDYFTPRYRYEGVDVQPGGEIYTRVNGEYPDSLDRLRENYLQQVAVTPRDVRRDIRKANIDGLHNRVLARLAYTGLDRKEAQAMLRATSDSTLYANYHIRKSQIAERLNVLNTIDTTALQYGMIHPRKVMRNERRIASRDRVFNRMVRFPYLADPRLDTIINKADGSIRYFYSQQIDADENTSKLKLFLAGGVSSKSGRRHALTGSDTLIYNVASMTTFVDESPRYVQRIITRDAEANAQFFFVFPSGKGQLVDTLRENRRQVAAVRDLTRRLMIDPVYIIDSITLRSSASPEGIFERNEILARERAEALRSILVAEFRTLYDSLKVSASVTLDSQGRVVMEKSTDELPNLPQLLRTEWQAEDWDGLRRMVEADAVIANKAQVLKIMSNESDPDSREWTIRRKFPKAYERMRRIYYPQLRAVDFRFNLHRRGMQQDTIYTTELDSNYLHAVELLKKRSYNDALEILRPYDDRNTALAYMSLGYDAAAYRILKEDPTTASTADIQYMLAILAARLDEEEQAVKYFLRSVELRDNLRFRGNLDPEISRLIRKYRLFQDE